MGNSSVMYELAEKEIIRGLEIGVYRVYKSHDDRKLVGCVVAPVALFAQHKEEHDGGRGFSQPREEGAVAVATAADEGGVLDLDSLITARQVTIRLREKWSLLNTPIKSESLPAGKFKNQPALYVPGELNESYVEYNSRESLVQRVVKDVQALAKEMQAQPVPAKHAAVAPFVDKRDPKVQFFDNVMQAIDRFAPNKTVAPSEARNSFVAAVCALVDTRATSNRRVTPDGIDALIDTFAPALKGQENSRQPSAFDGNLDVELARLCNNELIKRSSEAAKSTRRL